MSTLPEEYRVLSDPHLPDAYVYRCRDLVIEFRWLGDSYNPRGRWIRHSQEAYLLQPTPERRALWAALFVRPYLDSPCPE